jgi:hypothetical protein
MYQQNAAGQLTYAALQEKIGELETQLADALRKNHVMIHDFDLQSGDGTDVHVIDAADVRGEDACLWLVIDEDKLLEMIRLAFDVPKYTLDALIESMEPFPIEPFSITPTKRST